MITGQKKYILANIESVQNPETGDRSKAVTSAKVLIDTIDFVGVLTAQLGQAEGYKLSYSVSIPRIQFNSEKYVYFDGNLYQVARVGKDKNPIKMVMHVSELDDLAIKSAIEDWIDDNLNAPDQNELYLTN